MFPLVFPMSTSSKPFRIRSDIRGEIKKSDSPFKALTTMEEAVGTTETAA